MPVLHRDGHAANAANAAAHCYTNDGPPNQSPNARTLFCFPDSEPDSEPDNGEPDNGRPHGKPHWRTHAEFLRFGVHRSNSNLLQRVCVPS